MVNRLERVPQVQELTLDAIVVCCACFPCRLFVIQSPQVRVAIGVKESRAQALAKDFPEFLFHLRREVIAAQVVQVLKVLIDFVGIGKRAVNIVEVTDYQLGPIDEFIKFLSLVAHGLAVGVIEGKGHLDVGSHNGASQVGHQLVDGRDTRQQMRPGRAVAPVGSDQFLLQVVGEKLATAAVGKDKAVVLKAISPEVVTGDLLQKWSHNDNRFFISL